MVGLVTERKKEKESEREREFHRAQMTELNGADCKPGQGDANATCRSEERGVGHECGSDERHREWAAP